MELINPPSVRRVVIEMRGASCVTICQRLIENTP